MIFRSLKTNKQSRRKKYKFKPEFGHVNAALEAGQVRWLWPETPQIMHFRCCFIIPFSFGCFSGKFDSSLILRPGSRFGFVDPRGLKSTKEKPRAWQPTTWIMSLEYEPCPVCSRSRAIRKNVVWAPPMAFVSVFSQLGFFFEGFCWCAPFDDQCIN